MFTATIFHNIHDALRIIDIMQLLDLVKFRVGMWRKV